jgi:hypothetical protein
MRDKVVGGADKNMLTKVFTELIVGTDVNALDYMGLIDLLVEYMHTLFSGQLTSPFRLNTEH